MITCRGLAATTHRRHSRYLFEAIVKADERDDGLIVKAGERDDGLSGSCSSSSTVLVGAVLRGLAEGRVALATETNSLFEKSKRRV